MRPLEVFLLTVVDGAMFHLLGLESVEVFSMNEGVFDILLEGFHGGEEIFLC